MLTKMKCTKWILASLVCLSSALGVAAPGDLDTTFGGGDGWVRTPFASIPFADTAYSVIQQADGKLVAVGGSNYGVTDGATGAGSNISNYDFALARYNGDGSLDTTFNGTGKLTTDIGAGYDVAHSVVQQTDGKLVVVGGSDDGTGYSDFGVVRYNSNGSLDTTFNGTGKVTADFMESVVNDSAVAYSVIQQVDGKLVVAGRIVTGDVSWIALVRYNSNGSLDTTFNGTGKQVTNGVGAYSMIQQADGKLVVAGYGYNGSNNDFALVRYNADGSLDTTFDGDGKLTTAIGNGDDVGFSVIQQADGKLVVAGSSNGSNEDFALVRYNSDGSLDTSFDGDGKLTTPIGTGADRAQSVIQQANGKLVAAGLSYDGSVSFNYDFALVRYNADGSLDTTFSGDGKLTPEFGAGHDNAQSVIQQSDGKLIVAGYSSFNVPSGYEFVVARFESAIPDADGDGVDDSVDDFPTNPSASLDTDGDGKPDSCVGSCTGGLVLDDDDDNDGVADILDAFPLDATESVDSDGDGIGDNSDSDIDGDGIPNNSDPLPNDAGTLNDFLNDIKADKAGASVAFTGDFNADGYGDYIVGIPGFDLSTKVKDVGRAEVISGKNGNVLASLNGLAAKDALGTAVAGGANIDNDGFDDVVIGAPRAGATRAGSVTVLYGPNGARSEVISSTVANSGFGTAVALGNVNGDSYADILVGAPKDDNLALNLKDAGSVTVYSGNGLGVLGTPFYGAAAKANAGTSVASGDINKDGNADIVIGAPNEGGLGSVKAYTLAGTNLLQKTGEIAKAQFGKSVAVGDVNGDGYADVLVGAPLDDNTDAALKDTGSITVFSGSNGEKLTKKYGAVAKANLGNSVAAGDVDGDSKADIIAGTWKDDKASSNPKKPIKDAGSVSVFNGNGYAPITTLYGNAAKDFYGFAVSAGDINSDGKADLIIGIPGFDAPAVKPIKDAGKVTVVSGAAL